MPRGGSRQGTPGAQYPNRSDLQQNPANTTVPRALPVTVPPSAQYGQGVTLANAQKQVPTANGPLPTAPPMQPAPNGPQSAPTPTGTPGGPLPGTLTPLDAPTQRPNEHVMTGVPAGPGPGPEILPPTAPPDPVLQGLAILNSSSHPLPPEIAQIAKYTSWAQAQQVPR